MDNPVANSVRAQSGDSGVRGGEPGAATPAELFRLWRLYRSQCKTKVQKACCVLSPMDEMAWFNLPIAKVVPTNQVVSGDVTLLLPADPMRIYCMFESPANFNTVSPVPTVDSAGNLIGYQLGTVQRIEIFQATHGPLAQSAWYGQGNAATARTVVVLSLSLKDWPQLEGQL